MADWGSAQKIVQAALDHFGRIDVVVNNAGILRDVIFHKMTPDDWLSVIGVHLNGSFFVSRAAAEHFRKQESGTFVHITSTSGLIGNFGQANYSAAKLGITALSKSIALDMKRYNVRSNCIAPFAWSRMTQSIPATTPEQQARVAKIQAMTPDKNAPMAVFLSSDAAKDVNGQVFGTRMNEIFLFSSPRPIRIVHRAEGWTPESIAEHAAPALKAASCRWIVRARCSTGIRYSMQRSLARSCDGFRCADPAWYAGYLSCGQSICSVLSSGRLISQIGSPRTSRRRGKRAAKRPMHRPAAEHPKHAILASTTCIVKLHF